MKIYALCQKVRRQRWVIHKLKKTLQKKKIHERYDPTASEAENQFIHYWCEIYTCRHYRNGYCRNSTAACPYIHSLASEPVMRLAYQRGVNYRTSPYLDNLLISATNGGYRSTQLLSDILFTLYNSRQAYS